MSSEESLEKLLSQEFPQQKMRFEDVSRTNPDDPKSPIVRHAWYVATVEDMGDGVVDDWKVPTFRVGLDVNPSLLKANQFRRFRYERRLERVGTDTGNVEFHITGTTKKEKGVTIDVSNGGGVWRCGMFMNDADLPSPNVPYLKEFYEITNTDGVLKVEQPFNFRGNWEKKQATVLKFLDSALETAAVLLEFGQEHAQPVVEQSL